MRVLNVGGNSKKIPIPAHYRGWEHLLLDIDPRGQPDIVCDARELTTLPADQFNAVYCSHNLEHYYRHDGARVLRGFLHVLNEEGFAEIHVPDLAAVMRHVVTQGIDLEDVLYRSPAGPITVRDVIYGYAVEIERSGKEFFAHKTGFTPKSLGMALKKAGFGEIKLFVGEARFEVRAYAFKIAPTQEQRALLRLPSEQ